MYKLNFTKTFHEDVRVSVGYIRNTLQAPLAAEHLKEEVKRTYKSIKDLPLAYPLVHDEYLATMGFRFAMVKNYMLFFTFDPKVNQINIVRFLYGHRDWINILNGTDAV
jgi:plasmid stabilization system protein ParE